MTEKQASRQEYETLPVNDNLVLKQLYPEDAEALFALVDSNREYLSKWLSWANSTQSSQDSKEFIESALKEREGNDSFGYGMFYNENLVGHASLMHISDEDDPEIGYWIAE